MSLAELIMEIPAEHEKNVFGQFDAYAKKLGDWLVKAVAAKKETA